jgi:hypothetical protein
MLSILLWFRWETAGGAIVIVSEWTTVGRGDDGTSCFGEREAEGEEEW